jgi:hypothetical protein
MDQYPPGFYVSEGKKGLPTPGADSVLQTGELDAGPWGWYRINYVAVQDPRQGMRNWFWTLHGGGRLDLGK